MAFEQHDCFSPFWGLRTLFWLEESGMGGITLFRLVPNQHEPTWQGEQSEAADTAARYEPPNNWPLRPPAGIPGRRNYQRRIL